MGVLGFEVDRMEQISVENGTAHAAYDRKPDICPACHRHAHINPMFPQGHISPQDAKGSVSAKLQIVFSCPSHSCGTLFIAEYLNAKTPGGGWIYSLNRLFPVTFKKYEATEAVAKISPNFVVIFNQAQQAENEGLEEVAGIGFRRALEFLVKDYCILKDPSNSDDIKKKFLGRCIADHMSDQRIKACAERATWLGNDEAHYIRRWSKMDITDLKKLIELTTHWITSEHLTEEYLKEMPKP
jgi:hypothetical protein